VLENISSSMQGIAERRKISLEVADKVAQDYVGRATEIRDRDQNGEKLTDSDWLNIGLKAIIGQEQQGYFGQYASGYASGEIARELVSVTDELMDATKVGGVSGYKDRCELILGFNRRFRLSLWLQRRFGIVGPIGKQLENRMESMRTGQAVLSHIRESGISDIRFLVGDNAADDICVILDERIDRVTAAMKALGVQYPDYASQLQERYLLQVALRQEESDYTLLHDEAIIGTEVHGNLIGELEERGKGLGKQPKLDLGLDAETLVRRVPMFEDLSTERVKAITQLLKPQLAIPDEIICKKGEAGDKMYFISSGAIAVQLEEHPVMLGSGDFFGEIALLKDTPRTSDVLAETFSDLLMLGRRDFQQLVEDNPDLRETIEKAAELRLDTSDV